MTLKQSNQKLTQVLTVEHQQPNQKQDCIYNHERQQTQNQRQTDTESETRSKMLVEGNGNANTRYQPVVASHRRLTY